jgi:membrane-bound ClpP family serine protease
VLFGLLALAGLAGIVFGVLTRLRGGTTGADFRYENYGGPGAIIAGLLLLAVSLYLFFNWERVTSSRAVHHE